MPQQMEVNHGPSHGGDVRVFGAQRGTTRPLPLMSRESVATLSPLLERWLAIPLSTVSTQWSDAKPVFGWVMRPIQVQMRSNAGLLLPAPWEIAFQAQLAHWRELSRNLRKQQMAGASHGLWPWTTWAIGYLPPQGQEFSRPSERMMLVCLPPNLQPCERMSLRLWYPDTLTEETCSTPDSTLVVSGQAIRLSPEQVEDLGWAAAFEGEGWIGMPMEDPARATKAQNRKSGR